MRYGELQPSRLQVGCSAAQCSAGRDRADQALMMCYDQGPCLLGRQKGSEVLAVPKETSNA